MPRIPDHIIEQVRTQANIVEIIGEHVPLKRAGRSYVGLCPFHKEKTPSFNVTAERGFYKCFGCGRSGNTITFVQEHLHMDFPDAVRHLCSKMGITIPEDEVEDPTGMSARRDSARATLRATSEFYQKVLGSSDGAPARTFFAERGFSAEIIKQFALGASPASWEKTLAHLEESGYSRENLEDAGLVIVKDDGSVYDRFRGRAMFAIRDAGGRVVGFSARRLTEDEKSPKYINSPQSIVFDKSRVLFGLDLAKRAISEQRTAFVVEGQPDVIAMHQAEFTATVASSGTALTPDQLKVLKRYCDTIVLIFDADSAGQKAMTKGIEVGLTIGLDVHCVVLPSGEDPDSVIIAKGAPAMQTLINGATGWLEYQTVKYKEAGDLDDPVKQAKAVRTMLTWIAGVPDALRHPFLIRDLAEKFGLKEETLSVEMQRFAPTARTVQRQGVPVREKPPVKVDTEVLAGEREILRVALSVEHGLPLVLHHYNIGEDNFVSERGKAIFRSIVIAEHEHHDIIDHLLASKTNHLTTQCLPKTFKN